ncbi:hypothetical protein ElyMa_004397900 [Elysia marginata]|uniref:Uncharacterized protein n=1 Tax=Elysia marginata TaxID=1093978 RepID=A0AAV4H9X4_9GAST|nr:hypothetical protein ElyMa_004397900 [Elysia marginata]
MATRGSRIPPRYLRLETLEATVESCGTVSGARWAGLQTPRPFSYWLERPEGWNRPAVTSDRSLTRSRLCPQVNIRDVGSSGKNIDTWCDTVGIFCIMC